MDVELLYNFYYQVVDYDQMPSIQDWRMSEYPLCSVSVDNTKVIEDAGSRSLQVVYFVNYVIFYMFVPF